MGPNEARAYANYVRDYAAYVARAEQHGGQPVDEATFAELSAEYASIVEAGQYMAMGSHYIWTAEQELRMDALEAALFLYMDGA